MVKEVKIGIIGGTGFSSPDLFTFECEEKVTTAFGEPSDVLHKGHIEGTPCILLARHGRHHTIMPTAVNYRANLLALKDAGCTHVLVSTACGSLREQILPGHFIVIDQFIDRTCKRNSTFYDDSGEEFKGILHMPMATPFCTRTRNILLDACTSLGYTVHPKGTMVTIEGPRFSSEAESKMFRLWGGDVINMTTVPEVCLAGELGLCYASLAMATDMDSWRGGGVDVDTVMKTMKWNADRAKNVIRKAVVEIAKQDWMETFEEKESNVRNNIMLPK